ncbi:MAG: efflux RND transporter periplasmic adaptor subunit [Pseudomonadota bacterium]
MSRSQLIFALAHSGLWATFATVASVLFAGASMSSALAQRGPAAVMVERVTAQTVSETRRILGQVVVPVEADVASRTAGIIATVKYQVGDKVSAGQVLVVLDTELLRIELRSAEAALRVAEGGTAVAIAKLKQAEIAFERQAQLKDSGAFSRSRYDDLQQEVVTARAELTRARASVESSQSAIARAKYQLNHAVITAPVSGTVITRSAQPGNYIRVGDPVATLLDVSQLEISADVPVNLLSGMRPGVKLAGATINGVALETTVRAVIPVEELTTQTRTVRFTADFSKLDPAVIARGKSIALDVPASKPRVVTAVPKDALVQAGDGWVVFVVKDGKAMRRPITIGSAAGRSIEVKSGLEVDELVVVRGNERLRPGQPVSATIASKPPRPKRS